jgi:hypothetical protein
MQTQNWATAGCVSYFDTCPDNPAGGSGAQRFHRGFFGGKARGKTFGGVLFTLALPNLLLGKDASQKAIAKARDGLRDARNFTDVHSGSYDHQVNSIATAGGGCAARAT